MSRLTIAQIQSIINDKSRELGRVIVTDTTGANALDIDATGAAKITGAITGEVTANAGTNLNTSALALETGGNLAAIATDAAAIEARLTPVVDANNSSVVALAGGATFTGAATDALLYQSITINVFTDKVSANPGLYVDFSSNGTDWDAVAFGIYIAASTWREITVQPRARYFRVRLINGAGAQTFLRLQTLLYPNPGYSSVLNGETTLGKFGNLIMGQTSSGTAAIPIISTFGNTDGVAGTYAGMVTNCYLFGFNGTTWDRIDSVNTGQMKVTKYNSAGLEPAIKAASGATAAADVIQEVQIVDTAGRSPKVDSTTKAMQVIDYEHHEIHDNSSFTHTVTLTTGVGAGATNDLLFVTPNTTAWAHFAYEVFTDCDHTCVLSEDATTSNDGSARTEVNRLRNSPAAAACVVTLAPTVTGTGTQIDAYRSGAKNTANSVKHDDEFVLKQNAKYLFRVTTNTAATFLCIKFNWYEHTNA